MEYQGIHYKYPGKWVRDISHRVIILRGDRNEFSLVAYMQAPNEVRTQGIEGDKNAVSHRNVLCGTYPWDRVIDVQTISLSLKLNLGVAVDTTRIQNLFRT